MNSAKLFVISAPSGCGKGTILEKVFAKKELFFSVSCTTREIRPGEKEGVNYHYVTRKQFEKMIDDRDFLEFARYSDEYYGSPKAPVFEHLARGTDVILEVEVEGGFQVREMFSEAVLVFILPPSMKELERRLVNRGTDKPEAIKKRLKRAGSEIRSSYRYDYVILNDDVDKAVEDLLTVMESVRAGDDRAFRFSTKCDDTIKLIEKVITNA